MTGALFVLCTVLLPAVYPHVSLAGTSAVCAPDRIDEQIRVKHVIDGDTVVLGDGRHLRLIGVNTPELAHKRMSAQPYGIEARDRLRLWLRQHHDTLSLRYDAERYDHYGRLLAHAFVTEGSSVEAWLAQQGLGTLSVVPPNEWNSACYQRAEQDARQARRGIWALPAYQVRESTRLGPAASGYLLVAGRVQRVGDSRKSLWLNLDGGVALRIAHADLTYFRGLSPRGLAGKRVVARGWLHREGTRQIMSIRHPSALQVEQR